MSQTIIDGIVNTYYAVQFAIKPTMTPSCHLLIIIGYHYVRLVKWHVNHMDTPMYSLLPVQSIKTQDTLVSRLSFAVP